MDNENGWCREVEEITLNVRKVKKYGQRECKKMGQRESKQTECQRKRNKTWNTSNNSKNLKDKTTPEITAQK